MIYMYSHSGSENHGCEALVRTTAAMFFDKIKLYSNAVEQDHAYGIDEIVPVIQNLDRPAQKPSLQYYLAALEIKTRKTTCFESRFRYQTLLSNVKKDDVYLSIGGDNYCYAGVEQLGDMNYWLHRKGAKTVLWGCSVEPSLVVQPQVAVDLARYDLITTRETISYDALKKVNPNTVLVSDPAFTLQREDLPLPVGWKENNMVGINASPLILQSAKDGNLAFEAYVTLIQYIIDHTTYGIALIPHVVWEYNDDREPLTALYERFKDTGRVVMIEDHNCMELKGFIARCRFFVGARTHATIAAYSTCVPTLVLGYSVKSRGIARDLFGSEEHYVLQVQGLKSSDELANGFSWLMEHEADIRTHLQAVMPEYICKAKKGKETVLSKFGLELNGVEDAL